MTREEEINLLRQLGESGTYFSGMFSQEDIDTMCRNIQNDHPIDLDLKLFEGSETVRTLRSKNISLEAACKDLQNTVAKLKDDRIGVVKALLDAQDVTGHREFQAVAENLAGISDVIRMKLQLGYKLTQSDTEYIIFYLK